MKISFDFDSTLSERWVQSMAIAFIEKGHEVWVTTSRRQSDSTEVFEVTDPLGIPRDRCQFTHFEDKVDFLKDFSIHFDDDEYEIDLINRKSSIKCRGILIGYKNYKVN